LLCNYAFAAELNFFFLYLQRHLSEKFDLDVERGDYQVLTKPLVEKVRDYLRRSDIIIADVTGRTPNVMYELGYADAIGKPVILITQDRIEEAPADIRHSEFIKYSLADAANVVAKLDNAVSNILIADIAQLYERALQLLQQFNAFVGSNYKAKPRERFHEHVILSERPVGVLMGLDARSFAQVMLPKILQDTAEVAVMEQILRYLRSLDGVG
jgi:nucleoside 2-deoxyribosyltransferase